MYNDRYREVPAKHRACPCGCGELADECGTGTLAMFGFIDPPTAGCRDSAVSACSGEAKYAGRCGKHAARRKRRP